MDKQIRSFVILEQIAFYSFFRLLNILEFRSKRVINFHSDDFVFFFHVAQVIVSVRDNWYNVNRLVLLKSAVYIEKNPMGNFVSFANLLYNILKNYAFIHTSCKSLQRLVLSDLFIHFLKFRSLINISILVR